MMIVLVNFTPRHLVNAPLTKLSIDLILFCKNGTFIAVIPSQKKGKEFMKTLTIITASVAFALSTAANAQVNGISQTQNRVDVNFTGFVTNDVTDTIMIRQPDGNFTKYTGPVPDYPYKVGDQISISFSATLPNREFYEQERFASLRADDGIYRFNLGGSDSKPGQPPFFSNTYNLDISGPAKQSVNPYNLRGLTVVYDANKDDYSLELPTGSWLLAPLDVPSYAYNPETGLISTGRQTCIGADCDGNNVLSGNATSARINGNSTTGPINIISTQTPDRVGYFDGLNISGGFNLPFFGGGSSGNPTEVPEPATVLLFGAGAAALMRRRRKKA
jgi:PEP-CTERM motif